MGSPSDAGTRARPTAALLERLRSGKQELRARRVALPPREKVRQLLELQRLQLPLLRRQRPLRPWERPWDVEP
jgi:hypothetical protein